jgi:prevent-host-death family protein
VKINLRQIPAGEFKAKCLHLMDLIKKQRVPIIITKRGVPIAKLIPIEEETTSQNLFGRLKGSVTIKNDIIASTKEKWEADE